MGYSAEIWYNFGNKEFIQGETKTIVVPQPETINALAARYKLQILTYFGSFVTEHYRADSDIDIAYLSENPLTAEQKIGLFKDLVIAHRKSDIDLVDLRTAEPILRYEIATKGKPAFEQEEGLFDRYALFYIKQMYELRPVIQERMRLLMREIEELD